MRRSTEARPRRARIGLNSHATTREVEHRSNWFGDPMRGARMCRSAKSAKSDGDPARFERATPSFGDPPPLESRDNEGLYK